MNDSGWNASKLMIAPNDRTMNEKMAVVLGWYMVSGGLDYKKIEFVMRSDHCVLAVDRADHFDRLLGHCFVDHVDQALIYFVHVFVMFCKDHEHTAQQIGFSEVGYVRIPSIMYETSEAVLSVPMH
jgi:hypothetical protein